MTGIYMMVNKINGHAYIGQSKNINRRWMEHKCPGNRKRGTVLGRALRKYGIENFDFIILENCTIEELDEKECFYIEKHAPIYNMNEGGTGNTGHTVSDEVRKILSGKSRLQWEQLDQYEKQTRVNNNLIGPRKGHEVSISTREKLRIAAKEHYQKHGASDKQRQRSSEVNKILLIGNCRRKRRVAKVDIKTNDVLEIFETIKVAAESVGVNPTTIVRVCKGRKKTSCGYKWIYYD